MKYLLATIIALCPILGQTANSDISYSCKLKIKEIEKLEETMRAGYRASLSNYYHEKMRKLKEDEKRLCEKK